jgi:hypothetical protein
MKYNGYKPLIIWAVLPLFAIAIFVFSFNYFMKDLPQIDSGIAVNISRGLAALYTIILCIFFGFYLSKVKIQKILISSVFIIYIAVIGLSSYGVGLIGLSFYTAFIGVSYAIKQRKINNRA